MDWLLFKTTGALAILMVVIMVHGELRTETNGQQDEDVTVVQAKRRYKREWVKFAKACREEEDNSKKNPIAKISSDFLATQKVFYRISGVGVDQPPTGIFTVDRNTGEINITSVVDREKTPSFQITCHAENIQGHPIEKPLILTVKILDINDNPPVFSQTIFQGEVEENSASNTLVMKLNATDADEPNHLNSKIAFKIVSQEPASIPMFLISRHTGEVHTLTNALDREQISSYTLVVSGADKDGEGLSTQCECNIKVKDVNDNFPMFKESKYEARIEENTLSSELLRFQVTDLDEEFTDNWFAEYFFTSGNEGNWFEIQTDTKTNEGILKVVKVLDYEQLQNIQLGIAVKNKAEFHRSVISQYRVHSTPVTIQVINIKEGIKFKPANKIFTVQEGISSKKLINYNLGLYQAIDEDSGKASSSIRYVMGRNDGGLLAIDSKTAQIKFVKNIDRDYSFIVNKTITAEVLAIDDTTGKTATGTIYVKVPGFTENCPTIVFDKEVICSSSPLVIVSAKVQDRDKYSGPYTFSLEDQGLKLPVVWSITTINATSSLITAQSQISPGTYKIPLIVTDNQNQLCDIPENLNLEVCQCDDRGQNCGSYVPNKDVDPSKENRSWVRLGPAAIGLLLLGLLMLLLAPLLLLTCDCGTKPIGGGVGGFVPVPDGSEGTIHQWGIEGAHPEDKEITNICVPPITTNGTDFIDNSEVCTNTYAGGTVEGASGMELATKIGTSNICATTGGYSTAICTVGQSGTMRTRHSTGGSNRDYGEGAISMNFLDSYFSQKAIACAEEDGGQEANDCLLIYDNEGMGAPNSPVGSIGCCSFIAEEIDDSFLDSLGPKFKKLAEISLGVSLDEVNLSQSHVTGSSSGVEPCGHSVKIQTLQPAICIPDPLQGDSFVVTDTCMPSGSFMQPSTAVFDPRITQNVTVRERVICPISNVPGNVVCPTEIQGSCNIICPQDPCSRLI